MSTEYHELREPDNPRDDEEITELQWDEFANPEELDEDDEEEC